jgi:hypothetical protein
MMLSRSITNERGNNRLERCAPLRARELRASFSGLLEMRNHCAERWRTMTAGAFTKSFANAQKHSNHPKVGDQIRIEFVGAELIAFGPPDATGYGFVYVHSWDPEAGRITFSEHGKCSPKIEVCYPVHEVRRLSPEDFGEYDGLAQVTKVSQ